MDRKPLPPTLDHVTRDVRDLCRHSLIFGGRLLDFLAFNVPGIIPQGQSPARFGTGVALDQSGVDLDSREPIDIPASLM